MVLVSVTSFVQGLKIAQIVASAALEADNVIDFPIFLQQFHTHCAFELLAGGDLF